MDAAALDEMATADYGAHTQEYREELTELVHSPWLPDELAWNAGEVLALTRSARLANRRVGDPGLTALGRALSGNTATPMDELRTLFTAET